MQGTVTEYGIPTGTVQPCRAVKRADRLSYTALFHGYGSEIIRITDNMNIFSGLSDLTVHVRPFSGSWSSLAGTPLDGIQLLNARQLWKVREFPFSVHMIQRMRKRPAQKR